jgi:integrase
MPKPRSRKRWEHPSYRYAYCVERYDNVYTVIDNSPPVAIKGMKWKPENRNNAIRILDERVRIKKEEEDKGTSQKVIDNEPKFIYKAFEEFSAIEFPKLEKTTVQSYIAAISRYLPEDRSLQDVSGIRKLILERKENLNHAPNTQLKYLKRLNKFFNFCISQEYMPRNPIVAGMKPDSIENEIKVFEQEELALIYDYFLSLKTVKVPIGENKYRYRIRKSNEEKELFAYMLQLIAIIGTRGSETIKLWWDVDNASPIPLGNGMRSIISENKIIIDGKRSKKAKHRIREFPLDMVPQSYDVLKKIEKFKDSFGGKLFPWTVLVKPELWLRDALTELKLEPGRNLHSLRKTAINWWEKQLGIPSYICEYLAGHKKATRDKFYSKTPTAEELVNMQNKAVSYKFVSSSFQV